MQRRDPQAQSGRWACAGRGAWWHRTTHPCAWARVCSVPAPERAASSMAGATRWGRKAGTGLARRRSAGCPARATGRVYRLRHAMSAVSAGSSCVVRAARPGSACSATRELPLQPGFTYPDANGAHANRFLTSSPSSSIVPPGSGRRSQPAPTDALARSVKRDAPDEAGA